MHVAESDMVEREGPAEGSSRRFRQAPAGRWFRAGAVVVLLAAATLLRLDGVALNYPYLTYIDEGYVVRHAMNMFRDGTLDPHWYLYYPGLMNLINAPLWAGHRSMQTLDAFRETVTVYPDTEYFTQIYGGDPASVEPYYSVVEPPVFLLAGRIIVALFSAASVWVVYRAFRVGHTWGWALTGTFFFAFLPALVVHSHSVNNDMPMVFFFAATLWAFLRWRARGVLRYLVLAGLASGAAAAFKPTGILALGFPLLGVAAAALPWKKKVVGGIALCAATVPGFLALSPNFLANPAGFIEGTLECLRIYRHVMPTEKAASLAVQGDYAGWPFLLLAGTGYVLGTAVCPRLFGPLTVWTVYMVWFYLRFKYQPIRNLYPLAPILAFAAVTALSEGARLLRERVSWGRYGVWGVRAVACGTAALLLWNAYAAHAAWMAVEDSRVLVMHWLGAHASEGNVAVVSRDMGFAPAALRETSLGSGIAFRTPESFLDTKDVLDGADYAVIPVNPLSESNIQATYPEAELNALDARLHGEGFRRVLSVGTLPHALLVAYAFRHPLAPLEVYWRCLVRTEDFEGTGAAGWAGDSVQVVDAPAQAHSGARALVAQLNARGDRLTWLPEQGTAPGGRKTPWEGAPPAVQDYEARVFVRRFSGSGNTAVTVEIRSPSGDVVGTLAASLTDAWTELRCRYHAEGTPDRVSLEIVRNDEGPPIQIAIDDVEIVVLPSERLPVHDAEYPKDVRGRP